MNRTHETNSSQQAERNIFATAPDCLGCLLLSQPERCVEYRDGVRCDECVVNKGRE